MPVPPLPLEVISLIIDHLASLLENNTPARHRNGQAVALVCRTWRAHGTGLAWRTVSLDSVAQMRRVVEHLEQHLYAASHVRTIKATNGEASLGSELMRTHASTTRLADLFRLPLRLTSLSMEQTNWLVSSLLLRELSRTKHATTITRLTLYDTHFDCDPTTFLSTLSTFTRLSSLILKVIWTNDIGRIRPSPLPPSLLPLFDLYLYLLDADAESTLPAPFNKAVLDLVDPSTLRMLHLTARSVSAFPFTNLTPFSRLHFVSLIYLELPEPAPFLRTLVAILPELPELQRLRVVADAGSDEEAVTRRQVAHSAFPMTALLSSLPAQVKDFSLEGFRFPPEQFPPPKELEAGMRTIALLQTEDIVGFVPLIRKRSDGSWWTVLPEETSLE